MTDGHVLGYLVNDIVKLFVAGKLAFVPVVLTTDGEFNFRKPKPDSPTSLPG